MKRRSFLQCVLGAIGVAFTGFSLHGKSIEPMLDDKVRLFVSDKTPVSGVNHRDLWITPDELSRNTKTPVMSRADKLTGQWNRVEYPDAIAYMMVTMERTWMESQEIEWNTVTIQSPALGEDQMEELVMNSYRVALETDALPRH